MSRHRVSAAWSRRSKPKSRPWGWCIDDLLLTAQATTAPRLAGRERLDFQRRTRLYNAGYQTWRGKWQRERGGSLDGHFLEVLFNWLIEGGGTGDRNLDTHLALRIWDYDATRAKARAKKYGEYDLPSQNLG